MPALLWIRSQFTVQGSLTFCFSMRLKFRRSVRVLRGVLDVLGGFDRHRPNASLPTGNGIPTD